MNNTHNWNRDYGEQAWRKTRTLMWILHRTSVYANACMNDAKYSNPDSDTAVTSGWSANESLEFDPRPIDTDEQSSNSSLKAANTEARRRSAYSSRHSYPFLRSMSVRNPRSIVWLTAETPPRIRVSSLCLWRRVSIPHPDQQTLSVNSCIPKPMCSDFVQGRRQRVRAPDSQLQSDFWLGLRG